MSPFRVDSGSKSRLPRRTQVQKARITGLLGNQDITADEPPQHTQIPRSSSLLEKLLHNHRTLQTGQPRRQAQAE